MALGLRLERLIRPERARQRLSQPHRPMASVLIVGDAISLPRNTQFDTALVDVSEEVFRRRYDFAWRRWERECEWEGFGVWFAEGLAAT